MEAFDPVIRRWFDEGRFVPAILGDGPYYRDSHTWHGYHDYLCLLAELIEWAQVRGKREAAVRGIEDAVCTASGRGDAFSAFAVVWGYCIAAENKEDWNVLGVDIARITRDLAAVRVTDPEQLDSIWGLRGLQESVEGIIPELREGSPAENRSGSEQ